MEATLLPKWGQREKAKGKKNHSTPNQSITIRVMVAASSHVPFFLGGEYPNGYVAECYFLFLQVPELGLAQSGYLSGSTQKGP